MHPAELHIHKSSQIGSNPFSKHFKKDLSRSVLKETKDEEKI